MAKKTTIIASVAAAAATTGLAALAAKKMKGPASAFHVVYDADREDWAVLPEGGKRAVGRHPTKREAVNAAREIVHAKRPSRLVIHKQDGTIQKVHEYEAE